MLSRHFTALFGLSSILSIGAWPLLAQQKPASGPIARYDMRAGTITGVGGMGDGGRGAGLAMAFGGGGSNTSVQHELYLRLGSAQGPNPGSAKADHFMPPAAKLGTSVPLLTPRVEKAPREEYYPDDKPPKGRMLIYWGCGEHAGKGQPYIIDFAKLAAGQTPPDIWTSSIIRDWGPSMTNSRTFGRWPNEDTMGGNRAIRSDASLIGPHRVAGNYSPEMAFALSKDFMAGIKVSTSNSPGGGLLLRWNAVPDATGWYATLFGGASGGRGESADLIMWSSSATRDFGGLQDWLSPAQVAGLVRSNIVLPPPTTSCIVPTEVRKATEFRNGTLTAFGPEESFAYPPRPANPKAAWHLQWTARIRHRSMTSWMDMPGMSGGEDGDSHDSNRSGHEAKPSCKPRRGLGGLGGALIGGVLGVGGGC